MKTSMKQLTEASNAHLGLKTILKTQFNISCLILIFIKFMNYMWHSHYRIMLKIVCNFYNLLAQSNYTYAIKN